MKMCVISKSKVCVPSITYEQTENKVTKNTL